MRSTAPWRSGYAEVCKTFYTGSIPVGASKIEFKTHAKRRGFCNATSFNLYTNEATHVCVVHSPPIELSYRLQDYDVQVIAKLERAAPIAGK